MVPTATCLSAPHLPAPQLPEPSPRTGGTPTPPRPLLAPGPCTLSLAEFRRRVAPLAHYRDWADLATELVRDPVERAVIDDLVLELDRDGTFRDPLRIEDGVLTDGCHRYAALELFTSACSSPCRDVLVPCWVVSATTPFPGAHTGHDPATELRFVARPLAASRRSSARDADECQELALWATRSLPVGDHWLESDGGAITCGVVSIWYYGDRAAVTAALPSIAARLARFGLAAHDLALYALAPEDGTPSP